MKKKLSFKIEGMTCAVCSATCEKSLKKLEGVKDVSVNLATKTAQLEYDDEVVNEKKIAGAVEKEGYRPVMGVNPEAEGCRRLKELKAIKAKLLISLVFAFLVLYISMAPMAGLPALIDPMADPKGYTLFQMVFTAIVMAAGYKFYTAGFRNIFRLKPNMDSLVAAGTSASFLLSMYGSWLVLFKNETHAVHTLLYFESAAVIIALVMLGKFLETRSVGKAGEAVKKLLDLSPKKATVNKGGFEETVPVSEIIPGDTVIAKPGDGIAVDGEIVKGSSYIDESMLTGESVTVEKKAGQKVFAGTINRSGLIAYRAEKTGRDTVLSKIISTVEEAQGSKAPVARLADKVAGIFVPVVSAIALAVFFIWLIAGKDFVFALNVAVSVLVIACPCALGLATPAAIITGTGKGAQLGILFKSAESLENLSKTTAMVFDKTGTLTEGKPGVTDIYAAEGFSQYDVLRYAAAVEKGSNHPVAQAIIREAQERKIEIPEISDFLSAEGHGVQAVCEGKNVKVGNISFFGGNPQTEAAARDFSASGKTSAVIGIDGGFAGIIAVRDRIRADAPDSVKALKGFGIKTLLLTGDNKAAAIVIAREAGIDEAVAEVLPQGKADIINSLKEKYRTAMVGDGINDAPALAAADIGIAVGSGTDIAIESADIVITGRGLRAVADAVDLSRKVMKNIRENLFWAFFYNVIGIPVAAGILFPFFGLLLNPMLAALAMSLSSVTVVANALRLNMYKNKFAKNTKKY